MAESAEQSGRLQLQHPQPVQYKDIRLDGGYRIDMLVENKLILDLKSVEEIQGIHEAQLLTYTKLAGVKIGLLINLNNTRLKGMASSVSFSDSFVRFVPFMVIFCS